jgi:hypothetical protein
MNLKCKIISNIKIFSFFIIHVAMTLVEILLQLMMNFKKRMDSLWTFEMMTLFCHTQKMKIVDSKKES